MSAPQPIVAFGDTVTLVAALFAVRYLVVTVWGERGWAGFAARWSRRIAVMAMILLVLRLISIAMGRPEIAAPILWVTVSILASSGAVLMADTIIMRFLAPWARRRRS
jgi:phosphatidylglycerophosphate synthase